jgi:hypothetical protein
VRKCDPSVEFVERYAAAIDAAAERLATDLGIEAHYSPGFTGTAERVVSRYREIMEDRDPLIDRDPLMARIAQLEDAARKARDALHWTREYVGEDRLPAVPGWSWFDATNALDAALGEGDRMSRAKPKSEWTAEDWQAYRDFYTL